MVPPEMRQEPHVSFTQLDTYLRCPLRYRLQIAMVIENQVGVVLNWGFASALAMVLLICTVLGFLIYDRVLGLERLFEAKV